MEKDLNLKKEKKTRDFQRDPEEFSNTSNTYSWNRRTNVGVRIVWEDRVITQEIHFVIRLLSDRTGGVLLLERRYGKGKITFPANNLRVNMRGVTRRITCRILLFEGI